eukprot:gene2841-4247_t
MSSPTRLDLFPDEDTMTLIENRINYDSLSISYFNFNKDFSNYLKNKIDEMENLTEMSLSLRTPNKENNNLSIEFLEDLIKKDKKLKTIKFKTNENFDSFISNCLIINSTLTDLKIINSGISTIHVKILSHGLKQNTTLTNLDLSKNNLNADCAEILAALLTENFSLKKLNLNRNSGEKIGIRGAKCFAEALLKNTTLEEFSIAKHLVHPEGGKYLSNMLEFNKSLTSLDLSETGIENKGVLYLSEKLKINKVLRKLKISGNLFKESKKSILKIIDESSLEVLDVSKNSIDIDYLELILNCLSKNDRLTEIKMDDNAFFSEGINKICDFLSNNSKIKSFSMAWNNASQICEENIAKLIEMNHVLTNLDICSNYFSEKGVKLILNALSKNKKIKNIDISNSSARYHVETELSNLFLENENLISFGFDTVTQNNIEALSQNLSLCKINCFLEDKKIQQILSRNQSFHKMILKSGKIMERFNFFKRIIQKCCFRDINFSFKY